MGPADPVEDQADIPLGEWNTDGWVSTANRGLGDSITPLPQFIEDKGTAFHLDGSWRIVLQTTQPEYKFSGTWFNDQVNVTGGLNIPVVGPAMMPGGKRILIGDPAVHVFMEQALERRDRVLPPELGDEGYLLETFDDIDEVIIWANTPQGAFYGVTSLIQLVGLDASLQGALVIDYPEHKMRGTYNYYAARLVWVTDHYEFQEDFEDFIDWLAMHKYNAIMVAGHNDFIRDGPEWVQAYTDLFDYARERFIEPIPRTNSISTISRFPSQYWEGWPVYNESFTFNATDVAVPDVPYQELMTNGDFEVDADTDGKPDGWTVVNRTGANWSMDTTDVYSGTYSMKLEIPSPTSDSSSAVIRLGIPSVVPDSYYCIWAMVKAENIQGVQPQLTFYVRDAASNVLALQSDVTGSTAGWKSFGTCIQTPPTSDNMVVYARQQSGGSGTYWLDDMHLYRIDGGLRNMLRGDDIDLNVTDLSGQTEYVEGVDYEVVNGTIQGRYETDQAPFEVRRLSGGSITPGQQVLITWDTWIFYRYSSYWSGAPCVASEGLYTDVIFPAIDNLLDNLDPKIINIDLDEVRGFYRDRRSLARFSDPGEAFAYYANRIDNYLKARCPDCRLWIWDDMVSPYHNGGSGTYQVNYGGQAGRGATATEKELMTKNVIQDIWWYGDSRIAQMYHTIEYFGEKGYDVMGSPWTNEENIVSWSELLLEQPHSLGGIETNWGDPWEDSHEAFGDHFWNTRNRLVSFSTFEEPGAGYTEPAGWRLHSNASYSTDGTNDHGAKYVGFPNCAVNVSVNQEADSYSYEVRPNTLYNLSAYIKRGDPVGTARPRMGVAWFGGDDEYSYDRSDVDGVTDEYQRFIFEMTSPAWAEYGVIFLQGPVSGTDVIWYDNVRLAEETIFLGVIGPYDLEEGLRNRWYDTQFHAAGGIWEYTWSLDGSAGNLPSGLFLAPNGTLMGEPLEEGVFNFTVVVTDEAERMANASYSLSIRFDDIFIGQTSFSTEDPFQREQVLVNVTISRAENYTPPQFWVWFLVDDVLEQAVRVQSFDDLEKNLSFVWDGSEEIRDYEFKFALDPLGELEESYEDNNNVTTVVSVQPLPILYLESVTVSPGTMFENDTSSIDAVIVSDWNYAFMVLVELSMDGVVHANRTVWMDRADSRSVPFEWNATRGTHTYTVTVVVVGDIPELNDSDNMATGSFYVYRQPDVRVDDVAIDALQTMEDDAVPISVHLGADMELALGQEIAVDLMINSELVKTWNVTFGLNTSMELTMNWTAISGVNNVTVVIDPDGLLKEYDEDNNLVATNISVHRLPDLWVGNIYGGVQDQELTYPGNTTIIGTSIDADMDIAITQRVLIEMYVDGEVLGVKEIGFGTETRVDVKMEWIATNGSHIIKVVIDPDNRLRESDESNNMDSAAYQVHEWVDNTTKPRPPKVEDDWTWLYAMIMVVIGVVVAVVLFLYWRRRQAGPPQEKMQPPVQQPLQEAPPPEQGSPQAEGLPQEGVEASPEEAAPFNNT